MREVLIQNANLVNEGELHQKDLLIRGEKIAKISNHIAPNGSEELIDAKGLHLLPGWIDDQVHFREPGLTHKATIAS
jgi:dihydroorotase